MATGGSSLMAWPLSRAKARFSEVVRLAVNEGPQIISVRGRVVAVVVEKAEYDRLLDRH